MDNKWTKDDFNSLKLIGRAGKDFETRFFPDGSYVAFGSLATGGGKKADGGTHKVEWYDIKQFIGKDGPKGDDLADVRQGDTVRITVGRLAQEHWKDKTEQMRMKVVIKVEEFELIKKGGKGKEEDGESIPF